MLESIKTERLTLVPATASQLIADLEGPASLARALGIVVPAAWPPNLFDADAIRFMLPLVASAPDAARWGFHYVILRRDRLPGIAIGAGGFKGPPTNDGEVEIGYSILPEFQGQGFAAEAVAGWLESAFADPRISNVVAHTLESLSPSIRVLQRAGFTFAGSAHDEGAPAGETVVRYELERAGFETRRLASRP